MGAVGKCLSWWLLALTEKVVLFWGGAPGCPAPRVSRPVLYQGLSALPGGCWSSDLALTVRTGPQRWGNSKCSVVPLTLSG